LSSSPRVGRGPSGRLRDERSEDQDSHGETRCCPKEDEQERVRAGAYARAVGSRLRAVRKQMRFRFQRGRGHVRTPGVQSGRCWAVRTGRARHPVRAANALAKLYDVPVDQLLAPGRRRHRWGPTEEGQRSTVVRAPGRALPPSSGLGTATDKVTIDLHQAQNSVSGPQSATCCVGSVDDPRYSARLQRDAFDHHPRRKTPGPSRVSSGSPRLHRPAPRTRLGLARSRLTFVWQGGPSCRRGEPDPGSLFALSFHGSIHSRRSR